LDLEPAVVPLFKPGQYVRGAFCYAEFSDVEKVWVLLVLSGFDAGVRDTRGRGLRRFDLARIELPGYLAGDWNDFTDWGSNVPSVGEVVQFKLLVADTPLMVSDVYDPDVWETRASKVARTLAGMVWRCLAGKRLGSVSGVWKKGFER